MKLDKAEDEETLKTAASQHAEEHATNQKDIGIDMETEKDLEGALKVLDSAPPDGPESKVASLLQQKDGFLRPLLKRIEESVAIDPEQKQQMLSFLQGQSSEPAGGLGMVTGALKQMEDVAEEGKKEEVALDTKEEG
mmetsp:Transcript_53053/g.95493  ORF Transcript_53053/g.95493 Transcript_53053/m.95493 type:complete len:137 (+) Transcript_53053:374-784(+)